MKNLEEYLRSQRDNLDIHDPPQEAWEEVQKNLPRIAKTRSLRSQYWGIAASLLILISALFYMKGSGEANNVLNQLALDQELVQVDRDYARQIALAQNSIDERQITIRKMIAAYPDLEMRFREDLQKLSSTYSKLKEDLPYNANQEVLLRAMIGNLQLQINVLENQLTIIERIKNTMEDESSTPI